MTHTLWSIGYGGRAPSALVEMLKNAGVECVADVRLVPRGSMGSYTRASVPERGIENLLSNAGIRYEWFRELGNPDRGDPEMRLFRAEVVPHLDVHAARVLSTALTHRTSLLCGCKRSAGCHRSLVARWFANQGWTIIDLE